MIKYFRTFIFIGILLYGIVGEFFIKKRKKQFNEKKITAILYRIGSIGAGVLILFYFLLEEYAPVYVDSFFYWLWIPTLCLCLFFLIEARYHIGNRISYEISFLEKRTQQIVRLLFFCLGGGLLVWYGVCLKQRVFWPEYYQLAAQEEEMRMAEAGGSLHIPWVVEGEYVTSQNRKQEKIVPLSKKKLYFQYHSKKQLVGSQLHLEIFHYGKWYRLKEKKERGRQETKISERQWLPLAAEEYYEIDLNGFEGVIPGYYRICVNIEDKGYIDTAFWIK